MRVAVTEFRHEARRVRLRRPMRVEVRCQSDGTWWASAPEYGVDVTAGTLGELHDALDAHLSANWGALVESDPATLVPGALDMRRRLEALI